MPCLHQLTSRPCVAIVVHPMYTNSPAVVHMGCTTSAELSSVTARAPMPQSQRAVSSQKAELPSVQSTQSPDRAPAAVGSASSAQYSCGQHKSHRCVCLSMQLEFKEGLVRCVTFQVCSAFEYHTIDRKPKPTPGPIRQSCGVFCQHQIRIPVAVQSQSRLHVKKFDRTSRQPANGMCSTNEP
jgi:hypothetical protein